MVPATLNLGPTTVEGVAVDLGIYQGDDYELPLRLNVDGSYVNLTGYAGAAQIRTTAAATNPLATFTVTLGDQGTAPGTFTLSLARAVTAALSIATSLPVYDVQFLGTDGKLHTYLRGTVTIYPEVTRT